jgi:hypothetical protein
VVVTDYVGTNCGIESSEHCEKLGSEEVDEAVSHQLGDELAPVRAVIRKLLDEVSPSRLRLIAVEAIHTFFSQFSKRLRRVSGFLLVSAARARGRYREIR